MYGPPTEHIVTETENGAQFGTVSAAFAAIVSEIHAVNTVQTGGRLKEAVLDGKYNSVSQRAKGVEEASQDGRTATLRRLAASSEKDHDLEVSRLKTAQFKELLALQETEAGASRVRAEYRKFLEKSLALDTSPGPQEPVASSGASDLVVTSRKELLEEQESEVEETEVPEVEVGVGTDNTGKRLGRGRNKTARMVEYEEERRVHARK